MEIVRDMAQLERYIAEAVWFRVTAPYSLTATSRARSNAMWMRSAMAENVHITGIMQHIEEAGVHSGDSACSIPPYSLSKDVIAEINRQTEALARALNVVA